MSLHHLTRAYRILAQTQAGDTHLLVTDSRERAVQFFHYMSHAYGAKQTRLELGAASYTEQTLGQMP